VGIVYGESFLIDLRIEREDNFFPMVPAGAANKEMMGMGSYG
jgi:hypothetical protein